MTICDVVAFVAIMPLHKQFLEREDIKDKLPRVCRWANKVSENDDITNCVNELKLALPKAKL